MGWGAGAMFGYDSLWRYNARTRLCAPPTTTAASWGDRRSAALAASPARAASNAPRHALLRPHGEPPAAAECRPMAVSSTPQPRRERPRADRRHRPPRPPPGAIRGSSRISGAHCVECAAARSAVTAQRATSRGRASARCTAAGKARITLGAMPGRAPVILQSSLSSESIGLRLICGRDKQQRA